MAQRAHRLSGWPTARGALPGSGTQQVDHGVEQTKLRTLDRRTAPAASSRPMFASRLHPIQRCHGVSRGVGCAGSRRTPPCLVRPPDDRASVLAALTDVDVAGPAEVEALAVPGQGGCAHLIWPHLGG